MNAQRENAVVDAAGLVDIATGYMAAKQLFAAVNAGLFPALAGGGRTAGELAQELGIPEHSAAILANSMNALGLLERADGIYTNGPAAERYLAGSGSFDMGPFFTFLGGVSYPHWRQFDATVRSGEHGTIELDGFDPAGIGAGIGAFQLLHAEQFAERFDVSGFRRMLDLGGQTPRFAVDAMLRNPELRCDFVYQEGEQGMIESALDAEGVRDRATVSAAPTPEATAAAGHDLVLLNHCIHRFTAAENLEILRHAREAAEAGATLVIVDFVADADPRQRLVDAMHAAEYLVIDSTVAYPIPEIHAWMTQTGWAPAETIELPGSPRAVTGRAA